MDLRRAIIQTEILYDADVSPSPSSFHGDLDRIAAEIIFGFSEGKTIVKNDKKINLETMRQCLIAQEVDPEILLGEEGKKMSNESGNETTFGWETTLDDIEYCLGNYEIDENREEIAQKILDSLNKEDFARIEKAALYGDNIEEQSQYAEEEVEKILKEQGHIV